MFKHGVILLLVSLIQTAGFSQNMIIDSLETLFNQATDRQTKVDLLIELGETYQEYDYSKALALGYDALSMAESIAYQEGIFSPIIQLVQPTMALGLLIVPIYTVDLRWILPLK